MRNARSSSATEAGKGENWCSDSRKGWRKQKDCSSEQTFLYVFVYLSAVVLWPSESNYQCIVLFTCPALKGSGSQLFGPQYSQLWSCPAEASIHRSSGSNPLHPSIGTFGRLKFSSQTLFQQSKHKSVCAKMFIPRNFCLVELVVPLVWQIYHHDLSSQG